MVKLRSELDGVAELWHRLDAGTFAGPGFDQFQDALARYALAALAQMTTTRQIIPRLQRLGRPAPSALPTAPEDVGEVVNDAVTDGLRLFRRHAMAGNGWSPELGASITTYFVNACLLTYPNALRRWQRAAAWRQREITMPALPEPQIVDFAESIADHAALQTLLRALTSRERAIMLLLADGLPRDRIAEIMGMSRRAVDGIVYRARRKLRDRMRAADSDQLPGP